MVDTIYVEEAVADNERTKQVLARYSSANRIIIERYGEVFNSHAQNFRIQKQNPALILAAKQNKKVMPAPAQYETGGGAQYYFSHMLNCVYDCRYCFLQGMLRSANYLLFVNYEEFLDELRQVALQHASDEKPVWFFSGYDCDSLAYEPVTRFAAFFVPRFQDIPNSVLELRTKSTQIRSLLNVPAQENVVIAYSLSPDGIAGALEHGAPPLVKRLEALQRLQQRGWRIGIRFDPVIWHRDWAVDYQAMIEQVFSALDVDKIDSVTVGGFRLPKGFYKTMHKLYPDEWLFSAGLAESDGLVTYRADIEQQTLSMISAFCRTHIPEHKLFIYSSCE